MQLRTAVLSAGIFASGCSLIYASDLDGAHGDTVQVEGATSSSSGTAARDSGIEGGASSSSGEAGTDGASLVNGDPTKGCTSYRPAPKFCDDFDQPTLDASWLVHHTAGDSTLDPMLFLSAPNSVKVVLNTTKDCQYSRIEHSFPIGHAAKRITFATRFNLHSPWPNGKIPFAVSLYSKNGGDGSGYCSALFYVYSDQNGHAQSTNINVQSDKMPNHIAGLKGYPTDGQWSEVETTVTPIDSGGMHFKTTFRDPDGTENSTDQDFPECPKSWTDADILLGIHCDKGQATINYDNARVDWE